MSKAEDRYLEHFQDGRVRNRSSKEAFLLGYHQAEKDNELTWEDINTIIGLYNDLDDKTLCSPKRACKEILKQFKERREL